MWAAWTSLGRPGTVAPVLRGHRNAERQLATGLSRGARWTIAVVCGFFGLALGVPVLWTPERWPVGIFAGFCGAIALAAVAPAAIARPAGRLIGVAVFAACACYLAEGLRGEIPLVGERGGAHLVNAVLAMLAFGVPGAYYAIRGRFRDATVDDAPASPMDAESDPDP